MIYLLLAFALQGTWPEQAPPDLPTEAVEPTEQTLQIGSQVSFKLLDELSTKRSPRGQTFRLEVTEDVKIKGQLVIPSGTIAVGEVTRSDAKGAFGKSGKLEARVLYLEVSGRTVRMTGILSAAGKGGTTETVLTAIAAGTLAFAITGKTAIIPKGTALDASLDRSVKLPTIAALPAKEAREDEPAT